MALTFTCEACGKPIAVKFLRRGELAQCRSCGAHTRVPETSSETGSGETEPHEAPPAGASSSDTPPAVSTVVSSDGSVVEQQEVRSPELEFQLLLRTLTPRTYVSYVFIFLNVLVFGIMVVGGVNVLEPDSNHLIAWGANFAPRTTHGQWWRLFTCMFLHIGIIHLLLNMLVLWNIGPFIERLVGPAGFFSVYIASGLAGSLISTWANPYMVSAGASGAIFGLYGCLLAFLTRHNGTIPGEVLSRLTKGALTFVGYNIFFGMQRGGIDLAAHLGGLAGGFLFGLILSQPVTLDSLSGRTLRSAVACIGAAVMVILGAYRLPHVVDLEAEVNRFASTEKEAIAAYNEILTEARDKNLDEDRVAELIESRVLAGWKAAHEHFAAMTDLPPLQRKYVDLLCAYMAARQDGWELLVKGLHGKDALMVEQAFTKQKDAASALAALDALNKEP